MSKAKDPRSIRWDQAAERLGPLVQRFGYVTAAEVAEIPQHEYRSFVNAMRQRGYYYGGRIGCRTPEQRAAAVQHALAWEAAGRPEQWESTDKVMHLSLIHI